MAVRFTAPQVLKNLTTPAANPAAGSVLMYFKSDGYLYRKNSAGVESLVAPTGGGATVQPNEPAGTSDGHLWYDTDEVGYDFNWAQVQPWSAGTAYTATAPVSIVTYNGETYAAKANSTGITPGTDATKWTKIAAKGSDSTAIVSTTTPSSGSSGQIWIEPDGGAYLTQAAHAMRIQQTLMGGGKRTVGTSGVAWEYRFRVVGIGKYASINPDGVWGIEMPPLGTVIQKIGTRAGDPATATVTASPDAVGGRYVPLAAGETLWWVPPYGSVSSAAGEFIIAANVVDLTEPEYRVPDEWVFIVKRANTYPVYDDVSHIWGDGRRESMWQVVGADGGMTSFANGWNQYTTDANGYNWAAWQKVDGWVNWRGLIKGGTVGAGVIAINLHTSLQQVAGSSPGLGPNGDLWPANANGFGRIDVYGAGIRISGGNNAFCSLANLRYWVG